MSENASKVMCPGCGEVFSEFLQDMADHNETVVCPSCGHVHAPRLGKNAESHANEH